MTEIQKQKTKSWVDRVATYGLLLSILTIAWRGVERQTVIESKTLDTVQYKVRLQDHIDNTTFSEVEAQDLVHHAKDTTLHVSDYEVYLMQDRMDKQDSLIKIVVVEQWYQGQRQKRIETSINELKNQ